MKKNSIKKLFAAMTATALSSAAFAAMSLSSVDAAGTQVGQAYIIGAIGETDRWSADEQTEAGSTVAAIDGDAQYEVTWKVEEGGGTDTVQFLAICIAPAGDADNFTSDTFPNLEVTLDEVWIDGKKLKNYTSSSNAVNTKYYDNGGFTRIYLHDEWTGTKVADLPSATDITTEVRVKFTVSGIGYEGTSNVTEDPVLIGDVNGDYSVDSSDAALILQHYANIQGNGDGTLSEAGRAVADFNNDDTIDSSDAALILKAYAEHQAG